MDSLRNKTLSELRKNGFSPQSVEETERGYENKVFRANCESEVLAVKWFMDSENSNIPSIGPSSNQFIGGWYVQTRLIEMTDIPIPEVLVASFSSDTKYYVMKNIDFMYADDLWSNDMYLMRVCQEMGRIFSNLHSINDNSLGGIPGKKNDTMLNMRRFIKEVENSISETAYMAYSEEIKSLKRRYERIFNPRDTKRVIHGDPSAGNILTNEEGVVIGLVDWEDSMYADPLFDIAMFQAMVCDIFGIFSPWDLDSLRSSVVESYSQAVNSERLRILRALVHIWAASTIESESMLSPWNRVSSKSEMTRNEIHRSRFEELMNQIDLE